jgi:LPXTG-motif cell wall-anchored protein
MIFSRIFAILIIGGGYLIWNAIFKAYPFGKEYEKKPIGQWTFAFLIIIGQLIYIYKIFAKLFVYGESTPIIFLVIGIAFVALLLMMILRRRRG